MGQIHHLGKFFRGFCRALRTDKPSWPFLQAGLDGLLLTLRTRVKTCYGCGKPPVGQPFLPDRKKLALFTAKARTDCSKARRRRYNPRFSFDSGTALTRQYLQWAYGDAFQVIAAERGRCAVIENSSCVGSVNVD
jgi:hypothetical protein